MDRIADAFVSPFRDPEWVNKILIMGLILLIPIVGAINGLGWMLASLDRLRAGEERLAPANLTHLGRGIRLFAVEVIYVIGITVIALLVFVPAFALELQQGNGSGNAALIGGAMTRSEERRVGKECRSRWWPE